MCDCKCKPQPTTVRLTVLLRDMPPLTFRADTAEVDEAGNLHISDSKINKQVGGFSSNGWVGFYSEAARTA